MCLNYEHRRTSNESKNDLLNLKLKFSRLLICYATIILLTKNPTDPASLLYIFSLSPIERLNRISSLVPETVEDVRSLIGLCSWFLDKTGRETEEVLEWIEKPAQKTEALEKGRQFGDQMYNFLNQSVSDKRTLRYIVV